MRRELFLDCLKNELMIKMNEMEATMKMEKTSLNERKK